MSYYDIDGKRYYSYDHPTCPICGGKIKHPYTGSVTMEQLEEDHHTCQWIECIDEGDSPMGYIPICKKDWFKDGD